MLRKRRQHANFDHSLHWLLLSWVDIEINYVHLKGEVILCSSWLSKAPATQPIDATDFQKLCCTYDSMQDLICNFRCIDMFGFLNHYLMFFKCKFTNLSITYLTELERQPSRCFIETGCITRAKTDSKLTWIQVLFGPCSPASPFQRRSRST
jgi:hypothetical protein